MYTLQFSQQARWTQKQTQWQSAVGEAYALFAQKYPEWSHALFDEHFLAQSAGPFLADRSATPAQAAARMAVVWNQQLGPASPAVSQKRIADLTPAATDFLKWATAAYQATAPEFVLTTPRIA